MYELDRGIILVITFITMHTSKSTGAIIKWRSSH